MLRRVKIWTGPVAVKTITRACVVAGYADATEGTEHVYVNLEDKRDGWGILEALEALEGAIGIKLGKAQVLGLE